MSDIDKRFFAKIMTGVFGLWKIDVVYGLWGCCLVVYGDLGCGWILGMHGMGVC